VARQDSTRSVLFWFLLLAVPLLGLGIYFFQSDNAALDGPPSRPLDNPPVGLTKVISSEPRGASASVPATKASVSVPSLGSVTKAEDEPSGLDPETARAAVQKVENSVYERATAMFEREPIDVEWASAYEKSLREMFAQHQGLQRVSVNSISCHTTMCRIEVFTPRDADADFFTAMFYDGLASFRDGALKAEAAITRRMEHGMTSVYVARKDHTLGFY